MNGKTQKHGAIRDRIAYTICNFALNHIATTWYHDMIRGAITLGFEYAAEQSAKEES